MMRRHLLNTALKENGSWSLSALVFLAGLTLFFAGPSRGVCKAATNPSEVIVGCESDFRPYSFVDENGQPAGFGVDLIRAVAGTMNIPIRHSCGTWDTVWNGLVAGKLDALPVVAKMPSRLSKVEFGLPHTETFDAFIVRKGEPLIRDLPGARGKEIIVMRSDAAHHALLEHGFEGKIIPVPTISEMLSLLMSGKHDALLYPKLLGTMEIRERGIQGLSIGPPIPDYKRVFSFAVKKDDHELLEKLNQGLLIVKTSGEYDRIYEKWLTIDESWRRLSKYFLPAFYGLAAAALLAGFWALTLQRLVRRRTRELAETNEMLRVSREDLERKVAQRTADLQKANDELHNEVLARRGAEEALRKAHDELELRVQQRTRELKAAEMSLREINETLEQRIAGRTAELQAANAGLRDSRLATLNIMEDAVIARKQTEELNDELQKEIAERKRAEEDVLKLSEDMAARNLELESVNRELESFVYSVSHDLRAPLRSISGFTRIITEDCAGNLDAQGKDYLGRIARGADKMSRLIDALLHLSRISRQEAVRTRVDLSTMAASIISDLRSAHPARQVDVKIGEGVSAFADPRLMELVLANLLENAWKFTAKTEGARVEFGVMSGEGNNIGRISHIGPIFFVKDNGVGFDKDYSEKMFLPFHRLHSDSDFEGAGIGLSIVERVIRRHGGSVWAEGGAGRGAVVYFTLG